MNPRLPTELKKLKGTINTTREKRNPAPDVTLAQTSVIVPEGTKISCPKSIKTSYCRKYFKTVISNLEVMHVLSKADLPQIEQLCVTLEKLIEVQKQFVDTSVFDESFDLVEKRYTHLSNQFNQLASKYYISPAARTQLKLQDLTLIKTAQEIEKNDSAINNLLANRKKAD